MDDAVVAGGGVSLTIDDVMLALKISDDHAFVVDHLVQRMAAARAHAEGLDVGDDELAQALADFYADRDLFEDQDVAQWLAQAKITKDALSAALRERLLAERLGAHLVPDDRVDTHYRATRHDYATADIEQIEFDTVGAAAEMMMQVSEGEISWQDAAARAGGLTSDVVSRTGVPEEIAGELFAAEPGAVLGPIETEEGAQAVYRLIALTETELDDELREQIREELLDAELRSAFSRQALEFLV